MAYAAQHPTLGPGGIPCQGYGRVDQLCQVIGTDTVFVQPDAVRAEGIRLDALGARFHIGTMDAQHLVRGVDVLQFRAAPDRKTKPEQLRPHGTIRQYVTRLHLGEERSPHGRSTPIQS